MTYLDAAYRILHQAGQPLRYEEITERALAQELISPQGLTPEATMASRLYTDTVQEGSRFTRVDKGAFGLVDWRPAGIEAQVQRINHAARDQLRANLHAMPPDRFEALIGELLIQMGFDERTVEVTRRSGGCGLDVSPRQRQLFPKEGALLWTTHFMSWYNLPSRSFYSIKTQKMDTSVSSWTN
jgi:restriction system protein